MKTTTHIFFTVMFLAFPIGFLYPNACHAMAIKFTDPNVGQLMDNLSWNLLELKNWRREPIEKINGGQDGKYNLTVQVLDLPNSLVGTIPRLKICPIPEKPGECYEQEVVTPIDKDGFFKCIVYFRMTNWSKNTFIFKVGDEKIQVAVDEDPF